LDWLGEEKAQANVAESMPAAGARAAGLRTDVKPQDEALMGTNSGPIAAI